MTDAQPTDPSALLMLTADIVSAQVSNNRLAADEVGPLIVAVHQALAGLGMTPEAPASEPVKRPVGVRASIKPDGLISMIDGKLYQTLKRHLGGHGQTPERYRAKFGLSADYPMVSAAYSEKRSMLAASLGFGRKAATPIVADKSDNKGRSKLKTAFAAAKQHLGGD